VIVFLLYANDYTIKLNLLSSRPVVPNRWVATPKWVAEEFFWVANSSLNSLLKSRIFRTSVYQNFVASAKPKYGQIFVKFTLSPLYILFDFSYTVQIDLIVE